MLTTSMKRPWEDEVKVESVIIIALCSIFAVGLFFCLLFFYYLRGRPYIEKYVAEKEWDMPSLPSLPSLPSMASLKKPKMPNMPKMSQVHWPLSTVQIKSIPQLFKTGTSKSSSKRKKTPTTVSAPINILSTTNEAATGPATAVPPPPSLQVQTEIVPSNKQIPLPSAPPRHKKPPPPAIPEVRSSSPKSFATIAPRNNSMARPSAPPPVVPPVLDIGTPTAVTINGVTVANSSDSQQMRNPADVVIGSSGLIVPARPAMADEDMPDSLDQQTRPPPLPDCPPPEFEDEDLATSSSTDSSEV